MPGGTGEEVMLMESGVTILPRMGLAVVKRLRSLNVLRVVEKKTEARGGRS